MKVDKITKSNRDKNKAIILKSLGINEDELILFSAITKEGKNEVHKILDEILGKID